MPFNSIDFFLFLSVVFILYWFVTKNSVRLQNTLLVASSYFFYACWDWRFLSLILISTAVDFSIGSALGKKKRISLRKVLLWASILVNLGILGVFKYYGFFVENFIAAFSFLGMSLKNNSLKIILPVGISFYTFQTLSYTIDVYRRKIKPTEDFIAFSAFVSFFPQLVAGPIERAKNLLPQFYRKKEFNYCKAVDGLRQILWGLFKKVVIADNCAVFANRIFDSPAGNTGSNLILGVIFFSFQIYCDFSGYSDIAIGTARLFGIDLMKNFAFPYFSRDIAEFWRRWHISLSTWFRDYLYIPMGGSRGGALLSIRNVCILFIVSGFWHGAKWTFIAWGALNALYFLPLMLMKKNRINNDVVASGNYLPNIRDILNMTLTFSLVMLGWIFFRAETMGDASHYLSGIFSKSIISIPPLLSDKKALLTIILLSFFITVEWFGRESEYAIAGIGAKIPRPLRWTFYYFLIAVIFVCGGPKQQFIYFQF